MSFFEDPVYSWPSDFEMKLLESRPLSASPTSYVDLYDEKYVLKTNLKAESGELDKEKLAHEINMMSLAGPDCALPIIGRHFIQGAVNGFITRYEKCLTIGRGEGNLDPEVHKNRKEIIQKLAALIENLHSKGILHGDVKPSNLVLDDSGNLRFIDFAESVLESEPRPPKNRAMTTRYSSPSAINARDFLTRADDMYTAGMTMLHIYTGRLPFEDVDELVVGERIKQGLRPDLSVVDDEEIKLLIAKYLQAGEPDVGLSCPTKSSC
ncbi:kinase-like domain-containing protein [Lentinula raphanica]|nr:kinase-like domain-containing protein [Lentinula raphanica]